MPRSLAVVVSGLVLTFFVSTVPASEPSRPAGPGNAAGLSAEQTDGATRIWVESVGAAATAGRQLLRETDSAVTSMTTGGDPDGQALFALWDENDGRWTALSRDAGASWSRARRIRRELQLRDGAVLPGASMPLPVTGLASAPDGRLFIVQLKTTSLPEWRRSLASLGAELLTPFPHNGHIVRADPATVGDLLSLEFVERIEPYHPSYRLEPELRSALTGTAGPVLGLERVRVVTFEWGAAAKERIVAAAEALGAQVAAYWPSGHVVELWVDSEQLRLLASHDDVMWIDRWTPPGSDMDLVREDAGSNYVENTFGYCGQGVHGEVMDGGVQADHPDFDGILLHGVTGVGSHGTSTYGIVFGNGDIDGDGDGMAIGHLPCGQGIASDYTELTDRFAHTQELKAAPYFASFQSNSWGSSQTQSYTSDSHEMDDIIWRLDIAILNSQSNTGNRNSRPEAWAKNVISVGGIRHYDTLDTSDDAWMGGASIGPAADGRIKPDVSYWYDDIFTTTTGSGYTTDFGGTSAATPESAGTLGLMVQMWAENVWETHPTGATVFDKQPHFSTLKALLINNSEQYDFVGSGADLSRYKQGWGRPSAQIAHERAATSFIVDEAVNLEINDLVSYSIDVPAGETELKITMVYPDPPGTTSSSLHRINDVNVEVTSPSATTYHGNVGLVDGTASTSGGSADGLNTVENVFVVSPEAGIWTVDVEAVEINQDAVLGTVEDDVTFALVVTGGAAVTTSGIGDVRVRPSAIACSQTLSVRVRDGNVGSSSLTVDVSSGTETTPETLTLLETNTGSGNYVGQITTTTSAAAADGDLSVSDGDTVTVEYTDADDGMGGSSIARQDTGAVDCSGPVISNVWAPDVTDTEATLSWVTDEGSNSTVEWGSAIPPDQLDPRAGNVTTHTVRLKGLTDCTTYFFSAASTDAVGNSTVDDNGGSYYLFTTQTRTQGQLHSCREGTLVLEADAVGCSAAVPIRLTDADVNLNPFLVDTAQVFLSSSTETEPEAVILTETGVNTGEFTGTISTATGAAVPSDGLLQTADGDLVTGRYDDPDDGMGNPTTSVYTIPADCAAADFLTVSVNNITDADASVQWSTSKPTTGTVEWGTTPALGNQVASNNLQTSHNVAIGPFSSCGAVYFRVVATDDYGNVATADSSGTPFAFNAWGVPGVFYVDDFETDLGWTLEDEWEIGPPQGLGSAPGDPTSAFSGTAVLGQDLSGQGANPGDYEHYDPSRNESAISPVIDATSLSNAELKIRRWLNTINGTGVYIDVTDSGGSWNNVWDSLIGSVVEGSWSEQVLDISTWADGNPNLQIRIRARSIIASAIAAGWNVDDLTLRDGSLPALDACGGCGGGPAFAGIASAVDDDPCADTGVTLSWVAAAGWGTGTTGTYAVYRDNASGFTPGPGNIVASGLVGTSWTDTTATNDTDQYYVVRAENDEVCSTGPNNAGVTDANLLYAVARDATAQTPPGDVGNTLRVNGVNQAHARLSWTTASGAAEYRVHRSGMPDINFVLEGTSATTLYDDQDVFVDGQTWYYTVRAADACGNESAD